MRSPICKVHNCRFNTNDFEGTGDLPVSTKPDQVTAYAFQKVGGVWSPYSYITFEKKP